MEYLQSRYGLEFDSERLEPDSAFPGEQEFVASLDGYTFETYHLEDHGLVVYENGSDGGVAETSSAIVRDVERKLMAEVSGLSYELVDEWFE